jgi:hypothetical protein
MIKDIASYDTLHFVTLSQLYSICQSKSQNFVKDRQKKSIGTWRIACIKCHSQSGCLNYGLCGVVMAVVRKNISGRESEMKLLHA